MLRRTSALLLSAAFLSANAGLGQEMPSGRYQYAAKFVCGKPGPRVVAPGEYFSAINVHNPHEWPVKLRKKVAVALPGEKPGPVSRFVHEELKGDEAFEIDCPDILRRAGGGEFLKGFVIIESEDELDVVTVYTVAGESPSIHTERVPYRIVGRLPVVKAEPGHCPPGGPGKLGCCCNSLGPQGNWPDCEQGLVCMGNVLGSGLPTSTFYVCSDPGVPRQADLHSSQPGACGRN